MSHWELPLFQDVIAFHRYGCRTGQPALDSNHAAGAHQAHNSHVVFQECKRELHCCTLWHFGVSDQQKADFTDILSRAMDLTLPILPQL